MSDTQAPSKELTQEIDEARVAMAAMLERCRAEAHRLQTQKANLLTVLEAKQARIDALMLEFCPGEMSAEQRAEWAEHQRPTPEPPAEAVRGALDHVNALCQFAYQHGFHELGYDPVDVLMRAALRPAPPPAATIREVFQPLPADDAKILDEFLPASPQPPVPEYTLRGWLSPNPGCYELSDHDGGGWEPVYSRSAKGGQQP